MVKLIFSQKVSDNYVLRSTSYISDRTQSAALNQLYFKIVYFDQNEIY